MLRFSLRDHFAARKNSSHSASQENPEPKIKSQTQEDASIAKPARLIGPALAAITTEPLFYLIDTCVKRLQAYKGELNAPTFKRKLEKIHQVIFNGANDKSYLEKLKSLYKGLSIGMVYSIVQRTWKFGLHPIFSDGIEHNFGESLRSRFDNSTAKVIEDTAAAMVTGGSEVVLLGIDSLKVKRQTGVLAAGWRPMVYVIRTENLALWNGAGAVICRNLPGTTALLVVPSLIYNFGFGIKDNKQATFAQKFIASALGATACVVITNPADVIKVRTQKLVGQGRVSSWSVLKETVKTEGVSALGKGLKLRAMVAVPKLTLVQIVAAYYTKKVNTLFFQPPVDIAAQGAPLEERKLSKK